MTFASDLAAGLAELRGFAEERMRGTVLVERPTGTETTADGVVSAQFAEVYRGKGYVRVPSPNGTTLVAAGAPAVVVSAIVRIPLDVLVRPGDRVTVIEDVDNPLLADRVYRVEFVDPQSQATAQRLNCSDLQSGPIG